MDTQKTINEIIALLDTLWDVHPTQTQDQVDTKENLRQRIKALEDNNKDQDISLKGWIELGDIYLQDKKEDPVIDNSFDKQLVLFKPPKQSLMTSKPSPGVSLTPLEVKPSSLIIIPEPIKEPIIEVKTKKTWTLSEATRLKQSLAQQKRTKHPRSGLAVQVLDLVTNKTTVYSSYWEAARALNISVKIISKYFSREQSKPYKKRYVFTKV